MKMDEVKANTDALGVPSVNFEAVKTSMMQDKNGTNIRLTIHPNDVPEALHKDWIGSRYMVVMVKLNEDGTPEGILSNDTKEI
jgi:hypothetical protein|tara:strand:+ start:160 stop:408 length:249 start_codon:yes stop_codon:yes gene_type:complete